MGGLRYLPERIKANQETVLNRNRQSMVLCAKGLWLLAAFLLFASLFIPTYHLIFAWFVGLFLYTCVMYVCSTICLRKNVNHIRLVMYLMFAPILFGALLVGTYLNPDKPSISFFLFLCTLPMAIIDNPWRIISYQMAFVAMYVLFAYLFQPYNLFFNDVIYLPVNVTIAILSNVFTLANRVAVVEAYQSLSYESDQDPLTGLLNRKAWEAKLQEMLVRRVPGVFAIFDVDDFKKINDTHGHQTGDFILCTVAKSLRLSSQEDDIICRLGGDEFALFAIRLTDEQACQLRYEKLTSYLSEVEIARGQRVRVTLSSGCAISIDGRISFDGLYQTSDRALYQAKRMGKGNQVVKKGEEPPNATSR